MHVESATQIERVSMALKLLSWTTKSEIIRQPNLRKAHSLLYPKYWNKAKRQLAKTIRVKIQTLVKNEVRDSLGYPLPSWNQRAPWGSNGYTPKLKQKVNKKAYMLKMPK